MARLLAVVLEPHGREQGNHEAIVVTFGGTRQRTFTRPRTSPALRPHGYTVCCLPERDLVGRRTGGVVGSSRVSLCLSCAMPYPGDHAGCPNCHSPQVARVFGDALVEFPAHSLPCPKCGRDDQPLVFRTWAVEAGFLFWCTDGRRSAYLCPDCARVETAKALSFTGLLGWWSVPGVFFFAWRATYYNWRAIWTHPAQPLKWGAIPAQAILDDMRRAFEEADAIDDEESLFADSPLSSLRASDRATVLSASGLYGLLGVSPNASRDELRKAYAAKAMQTHPDLRPGDSTATEKMMRLNTAWSVLSNDALRAAYDWLEKERTVAM